MIKYEWPLILKLWPTGAVSNRHLRSGTVLQVDTEFIIIGKIDPELFKFFKLLLGSLSLIISYLLFCYHMLEIAIYSLVAGWLEIPDITSKTRSRTYTSGKRRLNLWCL
jgi:hypothetical protein